MAVERRFGETPAAVIAAAVMQIPLKNAANA